MQKNCCQLVQHRSHPIPPTKSSGVLPLCGQLEAQWHSIWGHQEPSRGTPLHSRLLRQFPKPHTSEDTAGRGMASPRSLRVFQNNYSFLKALSRSLSATQLFSFTFEWFCCVEYNKWSSFSLIDVDISRSDIATIPSVLCRCKNHAWTSVLSYPFSRISSLWTLTTWAHRPARSHAQGIESHC